MHCSLCDPHHASLCHIVPTARVLVPLSQTQLVSQALSLQGLSSSQPQSPQYPNMVGLSNVHVFAPTDPHLKRPCRPLWRATSSRKSSQPTMPPSQLMALLLAQDTTSWHSSWPRTPLAQDTTWEHKDPTRQQGSGCPPPGFPHGALFHAQHAAGTQHMP